MTKSPLVIILDVITLILITLWAGMKLGEKLWTPPDEYRVYSENNIAIGVIYSTDWCERADVGEGGYIAQLTYEPSGIKVIVYFQKNEPPQRFIVSNSRELIPLSVTEPALAESPPSESG